MEEMIRESKDKALKEEEWSFMAKFRAKEKEEEKRRHKSMLLNVAERKIQQAEIHQDAGQKYWMENKTHQGN